jgi:hypothetical protein
MTVPIAILLEAGPPATNCRNPALVDAALHGRHSSLKAQSVMARIVLGIAFGLLLALFGVGAANAATARASDPLTLYAGPGRDYAPIGRLVRNEVVRLAECTPSGRWCFVEHNGPDGWALASFLVGSAAKVDATPWRPLVDPFAFRHHRLR